MKIWLSKKFARYCMHSIIGDSLGWHKIPFELVKEKEYLIKNEIYRLFARREQYAAYAYQPIFRSEIIKDLKNRNLSAVAKFLKSNFTLDSFKPIINRS